MQTIKMKEIPSLNALSCTIECIHCFAAPIPVFSEGKEEEDTRSGEGKEEEDARSGEGCAMFGSASCCFCTVGLALMGTSSSTPESF